MQGSSLSFCVEIILSVLFLGYVAARKRTKKNGDRSVSRLRARRGLRALDLRKLLKKFDQNFYPVKVIRAFYAFTSLPVILSAT